MFTNTGTQEIAVEAMKAGLNDYVVKSPRHFIRLRQAVRLVWQQFQTELRATQLENRLQSLLNQLEVGIVRTTPSGALLDVNAAMLHMLEVTSLGMAQEILKTQLAIAVPPIPAFGLDASAELKREEAVRSADAGAVSAIALPDAAKAYKTTELQLRLSNWPALWIKAIATLNLVNGEWIVDGLIENITRRKQAEEDLSLLNQIFI